MMRREPGAELTREDDYDATMIAMEAASAVHRAAHPVPADPVPLAVARNASRSEALNLLADRAGTPREILIASMLATAERPTSDGELSARDLEDSLHDRPDPTTRKGSIAMAASLLTTRMTRPKGPVAAVRPDPPARDGGRDR